MQLQLFAKKRTAEYWMYLLKIYILIKHRVTAFYSFDRIFIGRILHTDTTLGTGYAGLNKSYNYTSLQRQEPLITKKRSF